MNDIFKGPLDLNATVDKDLIVNLPVRSILAVEDRGAMVTVFTSIHQANPRTGQSESKQYVFRGEAAGQFIWWWSNV